MGVCHLPPDAFTMYVIARSISRSLKSGLPPCAGMLRMPVSAFLVRLVRPRAERSAQAFLSPIFGAPLAAVAWALGPWHWMHTASTTALPLRWLCDFAGAA